MILTSNYTRSADRNLTAEGYKLLPSQISPTIIDVVKPTGAAYRVDLVAGTCNCAAGQRGVKCCHLREAAELASPKPLRPAYGTEAYRKMVAADFD